MMNGSEIITIAQQSVRPGKPRKALRPLLALLLCGLILTFSACDDGPDIDRSGYDNFVRYEHGLFIFYISPKSKWLKQKESIGRSYGRFLGQLCELLEMPIPDDKITMYIYNNMLECREITGQDSPFSFKREIHWGGGYPYGYQLTKFLLEQKGVGVGQFDVLNEGLAHLLDFSGFNYHDKTNRLNNSGMIVHIELLGDNLKFNELGFSERRSMSASLCGYLMYNFGLMRLLMLRESSAGWQRSIETIFQLPIDDMQNGWLLFAKQQANDPDGTTENDTIQDMRIEKDGF